MPDRMPDKMPEDMSNKIPENLSVIKYINVMVRIIQNKVIYLTYYYLCVKYGLNKIKYLRPPLSPRSAPSHPHPLQTIGGKTDILKCS
jgi:hypothetical protein